MSHYNQMVIRQRKWMLYLLALLVLGAGFSSYPTIFLGLLLGSSASFFNMWILQRKIRLLGEAVAEGKSVYGIGTFSRLAAVGLAIVIASRFEEYFHILAVVAGLGTSYCIMMLEFGIRTFTAKGKQLE
ncbi:ATP synthase subunit I [Lentibacillus sp. CBA3610]|uniref:ATP synthase subunit I n=1 Tax=Lentibacillus sp. CBA3610 TaxID=2518176 RepID=UPI00159633B9|nr:ATP synthase subunit I [Lentibacillus sp. CBA3610]QKY70479.1 ATP synthase subunit I [Lentibacillus sp. CBA3610]